MSFRVANKFTMVNSGLIRPTPPPIYISGSGGTVTTNGNYRTHTFTSNGTFTILVGNGELFFNVAGAGGGGTTGNSRPGRAGGRAIGTGSYTSGSVFTVRAATGGTKSTGGGGGGGSPGGGNGVAFSAGGGGYSGVFSGVTVSQGTAIIIAGGGAGGEQSTTNTTTGGDPTGGGSALQGGNGTNNGGGGGGGYVGGRGGIDANTFARGGTSFTGSLYSASLSQGGGAAGGLGTSGASNGSNGNVTITYKFQ